MPPGFVETPTPTRRNGRTKHDDVLMNGNGHSQDFMAMLDPTNYPEKRAPINGHVEKQQRGLAAANARVDDHPQYEFGGTWGVTVIMLVFPILMWWMWVGATYYDGQFPARATGQSYEDFLKQLVRLVYAGAFPSAKAWAIYWIFILFEAVCYLYLPGVYVKGQPLPHEGGKQLDYYCSAQWSWYTTIATALALHVSGIFPLYTILDEFGPIMSVAMISGFLMSCVAYASAIYRGAQHRMTGAPVYDFFMGAELNPRLFGILDFKMFLEIRIPWYMLFLLSFAAATRQYEQLGYVSGEVGFLVMAHFLYGMACGKGEECIVPTWDMYHEKMGFMLIFWNMAGVPLSYCHCTIYLASHSPSVYHWHWLPLTALYISYLFVYWVWDTTNSQKNKFRQQERGKLLDRGTYPRLPWSVVRNPKKITTDQGDSILIDGWCKLRMKCLVQAYPLAELTGGTDQYARKLHYTCDMYFAVCWALVCGFNSFFPWFYAAFFLPMILHRALRDDQKCAKKYGKYWTEYKRQVPYLFIPVSSTFPKNMRVVRLTDSPVCHLKLWTLLDVLQDCNSKSV